MLGYENMLEVINTAILKSLGIYEAMIADLLTIRADREAYYYGCDLASYN